MHPRKMQLARWQDLSDDVDHGEQKERVDEPVANAALCAIPGMAETLGAACDHELMGEKRGGLDEPDKPHSRSEVDPALCAIPGMAETLGAACTGVNSQEHATGGQKQRARPLMRVPAQEEEEKQGGEEDNEWAKDKQVINRKVPGTAFPNEKGSPVGELEEHVKGQLLALRKLLDKEHHNIEPRGGLEEPSSAKASTPTRREQDAGLCGIPIIADVFKHMCQGVNPNDDDVDWGKQRARPLYAIPVNGHGHNPLKEGDDDDRRRGLTEPIAGHNFPYEEESPVGEVDAKEKEAEEEGEKDIMGLDRHGPKRGGLDEAEDPRWVRQDRDPWYCTIPLLADAFGGFRCRGFVHAVGEVDEGKQQQRPQLPARLSEEEEERQRMLQEGRKLRERAEAVDAAEDKMGRYYGSPPSLVIARQPKDRIVPAEGGETQEESWDKLQSAIAWLRRLLPGFPTWPGEWSDTGDAAPCGKNDIACGSDLTLHAPHIRVKEKMAPFVSPFAGYPIRAKRSPPGKPVPCLHPFCDQPHVGDKKEKAKEEQAKMRSIFAGRPIGPTNANSAGEPVPCLHPFCGSTATLHKPIKKIKEKEFRFVPFTAGYPIRPRGGKGTGEPVRCVGPTCNSAPYIGDLPPIHKRAPWINPFRGTPIGPGVHKLGAPVPLSHTRRGFHWRSPFAGAPLGTQTPPNIMPYNHKGTYAFPGSNGWHGAKGAVEHIGGLEDVHYPAGKVRPWMFKQLYPPSNDHGPSAAAPGPGGVYPGQQLRGKELSPEEAAAQAEEAEAEAEEGKGRRGRREEGGEKRERRDDSEEGLGGLKELLGGVWQVSPRDIASAAI